MFQVREKQSMDAPASAQTQYHLFVGGSFSGTFSNNLDQDWIRVDLVAGKTYLISLSGSGDNSGADTILRVYNSSGEQVALNDDTDLSAGQLNSTLSFTPESSGVYYLSAGVYAGNPAKDYSGSYMLTLTDPEAADGIGDLALQGGDGDDILGGADGADELRGGAGNDELYGFGGEDYLVGEAGDDLLEGGDDADLLLGDSDSGFFARSLIPGYYASDNANDDSSPDDRGPADVDSGDREGPTALAEDVAVPISEDPLADLFPDLTRAGTLDFLERQLRAGNDVLHGGAGADWLEGGAGNDELFGGDDDDNLFGDTSLELFFGSLPAIVVNDASEPNSAFVLASPAQGEQADAGATTSEPDENQDALDNLLLMLLIDQLTAGDDRLDGGAGNDYLRGGFGNDVLLGGAGIDWLEGGAGNDELDAGTGDDYLRGDAGDDLLAGGSGADWLEGGSGNDTLDGGAGDDVLTGDDYPYFLFLESNIGRQADNPDAGDTDTGVSIMLYDPDAEPDDSDGPAITSVDEDDNGMTTGNNPGVVIGVGSSDANTDLRLLTTFLAPGGDDTLSGGMGDDLLDGGPGNDLLTGGTGADVFIFIPAGGYDVVADFHANEDQIDLKAFADISSIDDLALQQQGDDLIIDLSAHAGGEVTLQGVEQADLNDANFIFSTGEASAIIA